MERFWSRVDRRGEDECWEWQGWKNDLGYGTVMIDTKRWQTHRLAYTLANGAIEDGLWICHRCDNPPCCNPRHLFAGTARDNILDCVEKGRWGRVTSTGHAGIDDATVIWIREQYWMEGVSQNELAYQLGVSQPCIYYIVHGKNRKRLNLK